MTLSIPESGVSLPSIAPNLGKGTGGRRSLIPFRLLPMLPLVVLLVVGGGLFWRFWPRGEEGVLALSGRIEGYPTDVDTKVSGRIEAIAVREGETVQKGQVLAILDEAELEAQVTGAQARLQAAKDRQQQAQLQQQVIQNQIQEVNLSRQQAEGESAGRVSQAEGNLAVAEAQYAQTQAQLQQSQAQLALAKADRDRIATLFQQGAVSRQQYDQAQTAFDSIQAAVNSQTSAVQAAQRQVAAAQGALTQAQSSALNPDIRQAQIATLEQQLAVAQAQIATAQAEVASAQAGVQELMARLSNLRILSPIDGVVLTRSVEPGTVISPGATLLTLINPTEVYLRGFIPEGDIGAVRVGQPAQVYLDSFPETPLNATVRAIDTVASFTPENIYFKEDRVRQVFGVELQIENPEGFAKPGMPADGKIQITSNP